MPFRKNVFIIGAGASAHTGAPLMKNFLETAREVVDSRKLQEAEAERFQNVLTYRNQHDGLEEKAGLDLTNIEDLFGLVDLHVRVEPEKKELRKDLIFLILKTLEQSTHPEDSQVWKLVVGKDGVEASPAASLSAQFVSIVARRWEPPRPNTHAQDSIVSLNYDLILERAMASCLIEPDYALGSEFQPPRRPDTRLLLRLLKLHGSANWAICSEPICQKVKVYPLEHATVSTIESEKCQCGKPFEPFIVPPTWSKGEFRASLQPVWTAAFQELLEARRWVLIGTSLPESDRFLRYFLGLALERNRHLDRIVIVNPDIRQDLYGPLFAKLPRRISTSTPRMDFRQAVGDAQLQVHLGQHYDSPQFDW